MNKENPNQLLIQLQSYEQATKKSPKYKVFNSHIVANNPIFTFQEIEDFYRLFDLYADSQGCTNLSEMADSAKQLGYNQKNKYAFDAIIKLLAKSSGKYQDFLEFLTNLTDSMGNLYTEKGRESLLSKLSLEGEDKLTFNDLIVLTDFFKLPHQLSEIQQITHRIGTPETKQISLSQKFSINDQDHRPRNNLKASDWMKFS